MDVNGLMKSYFLKVALPLAIVAMVCELAFDRESFLGSRLAAQVKAGSMGTYFLHRGGHRHGTRGRTYTDTVNLAIYEGDKGRELPLKDFMVNHVTLFEPAILLGLVEEWPALENWNLTAGGQQNLQEGFGDELVQVLNYTGNTYSYYWKSTSVDYWPLADAFDAMENQRDYSDVYKTRSGRPSGTGTPGFVVLDQDIPQSLKSMISEPKVTEQLLDLQETSMNLFSKGSKSVLRQKPQDLLTCVASGSLQWALVSPWETDRMRVGKEFASGRFLPNEFSPLDLFNEDYKETKVHLVKLEAGDCLYIPAFWWHQSLSAPIQSSLSVDYWYAQSSSWADLIMEGVRTNTL